MRYCETRPSRSLQPFVECFWTLEGDGPVGSSPPERILPDGCIELILNFGDRFLQHAEDQKKLQPCNFIVGQMTGPILISPSGRVELLGIRFQPGGARAFVDVPADEITDQVVDLGGVSARLERDLWNACANAPALDRKVAAVDVYLSGRLSQANYDRQLMLRSGAFDSRLRSVCTTNAGGAVRCFEGAYRIVHAQSAYVEFFQYNRVNFL